MVFLSSNNRCEVNAVGTRLAGLVSGFTGFRENASMNLLFGWVESRRTLVLLIQFPPSSNGAGALFDLRVSFAK
jgi:hypothetical protein